MKLDKTKVTIKNIAFNFAFDIITIVYFLFLTPIILNFIDVELYGIWEIILSFIVYLALLSFGSGYVIVKYVSNYCTKKNINQLNKTVHSITILVSILGLIGSLIIIFVFTPILINMYAISAVYIHTIIIVNIILGIHFLFDLIVKIYDSILQGMQRFDYLLLFKIIRIISVFIGSLIVLYIGWGLIGLVLVLLMGVILTLILDLIFIKKSIPGFKILPRHFDWENAKLLYKISGLAFIMELFFMLLYSFDKIYVGLVFSFSLVAYYAIAFKVMDYSFGSISRVYRVLFPLSAEFDANKDLESIKDLHQRGIKYISLLMFPFTLCLLLFSGIFITLWLGPGFEITSSLILLFCIGFIFNTLNATSHSLLLGIGHIKFCTAVQVLLGSLTIVNFLILNHLLGIFGMPISFLIYFLLMFILEFVYLNKNLEISSHKIILHSIIHPLVSTLLTAIFGFLIIILWPPQTYIIIGIEASIVLLINIFFVLITRVLDDRDKELILSYLPFLKIIFKVKNRN